MKVEEKIPHHKLPDIYFTLATTIDAATRIQSIIFLWDSGYKYNMVDQQTHFLKPLMATYLVNNNFFITKYFSI